MAIDIYTEPTNTEDFFAYNDVYFDASSDEATIINMLFDVYINGSYVATLDKSPNLGTSDEFTTNIKSIIQDHLQPEIDNNIAAFGVMDASTSACAFKVRAFEVLDNGTTYDTSWSEDGAGTNYAESTTYNSINGGLDRNKTKSDYVANSASSKFLTNRPIEAKILDDTNFQIDFYTLSAIVEAELREYDSSDSLLLASSASVSPTYGKGWIKIVPSTFQSTTDYFTVNLDPASAEADLTESKRYNIESTCNPNVVRLFWQNPLGGWDYYHFTGNRELRERNSVKTYDKELPRNFTELDTEKTVLNVNSTQTYKVWTDTRNKAIIQWLAEIGRSEQVYWYDGTNYIPIVITGSTQKVLNDRETVKQFAVTFRLSSELINQRG